MFPWGLRLRWPKTFLPAKTLQSRVIPCHLVALWRPVTVKVTMSSQMPNQPGEPAKLGWLARWMRVEG